MRSTPEYLSAFSILLALMAGAGSSAAQMSDHGQERPGARARPSLEMVTMGRALVLNHGCANCHGRTEDPAAQGYMAGIREPDQEFLVGPCATHLDAKPCWHTRPRNLTPDNATGIGRFSERQLFNSLRFGLRPGETPDVVITSTTPGTGNFPANPHYLAPPMPWPAWRHMSDRQLWAIAAYLKHGLRPVVNKVPDSEGPPDFWASVYTVAMIGSYPAARYPTAGEKRP